MAHENDYFDPFLTVARPIVHARGGVVFRHNDLTRGIPDASFTVCGRTCWIDAKRGTLKDCELRVDMRGRALQHQFMRELDFGGLARYLVWVEHETGKKPLVMIPRPVFVLPRLLSSSGCVEITDSTAVFLIGPDAVSNSNIWAARHIIDLCSKGQQ